MASQAEGRGFESRNPLNGIVRMRILTLPEKKNTEKEKKKSELKVLTLLLEIERADSRTRTGDPRITNALLYQLSHIGSLSKISLLESGCKGTTFFFNHQMFWH